MIELTEELRNAYEATDQILANRPDDEFLVAYESEDGGRYFVMQWNAKTQSRIILHGVNQRDNAQRFTFCAALDVRETLDKVSSWVCVMLVRDAPESFE